jgi:hypothetical protein
VAPVRNALGAARGGGLYPAESAPIVAAAVTEFVLVAVAEVLDRLDERLPQSLTRS